MTRSVARSIPALALLASSLLLGCGGEAGGTNAQVAESTPVEEAGRGRGMQAQSEIGGLNAEDVDKVFARSLGALQACLEEGASRVELLGGAVDFFLKIDADGRIAHAHLERSTLGDRDTERCMLAALRAKTWPKPIGGTTGLARKGFEFDPPKDVRPPTDWDPAEVQETVSQLEEALTACKDGASGSFEATAYVD